MSAEELAALAGEAAQVDAQIAPQQIAPQQDQTLQQAGNEAAEIAALVQITAGLFSPIFPSLRDIYTDEACKQVGDSAAPVMAKHGWSTGAVLGKYAEELALLAVVVPLGISTWQGIQKDLAAKTENDPKAEPKAEESAQSDVPNIQPRA